MMTRTISSQVTFSRPFRLDEQGEWLPAGRYEVETDEEILEGLSFLAYRRVATAIYVPARPENPGSARLLMIDPIQLEAALARDIAEQQPVDRAENEGMIRHGTSETSPH